MRDDAGHGWPLVRLTADGFPPIHGLQEPLA
jgi:hypothetical protein